MRSCPHCGRDLAPRDGAAETASELRAILEAALAVPVQEDAYIVQDALRLIANEDATIDEIRDALAAWNAGKRPSGVKRLKMFQAKTWPKVARACLDREPDAAPQTDAEAHIAAINAMGDDDG